MIDARRESARLANHERDVGTTHTFNSDPINSLTTVNTDGDSLFRESKVELSQSRRNQFVAFI